jgi:predicted DNA-binding helix-hairpin-helix protein
MIIGASPERDGQVLRLTQALYRQMDMKRVYYSSYVPVVHDSLLPEVGAGQLREHRLYQADWLLRFYGFTVEEIVEEGENLPLEYDPKCAWALKNMQHFPIEIQTASVEQLLRVPGIGAKGAYKIVSARKYTKLTFDDLKKMRIVLKRAKHFITCSGKFYGAKTVENAKLQLLLAERSDSAEQMSLFSGGLAEKYVPNTLATEATLRLKESVKANEKIVLHSTPATALSVLTGEI